MARPETRRERHVLRLLGQARQEVRSGRWTEALRLQAEAIRASRALAEQHPGDPRHQLSMASALYSLGGMLTSAGRPAEAVGALDEGERLYRLISGSPGMPETAPLIADIAARRALALAADGLGASAVPQADTAVTTYEELAGADSHDPRQRDLARVYADNAKVLARFGDPDLAVGSADRAIRIYLARRPSSGTFAVEREEMGYLVLAASVAATIHAWHGRIEVSLAAAQLAMQFAGPPAVQEALRSVGQRVDRMTAGGRASFGADVAAALRRPASPSPVAVAAAQPAREPIDPPDVAIVLNVMAMLQQAGGYVAAPRVTGSAELTTLASALAHTGHADLAADLTRPALDCAISTPAGRSPAQAAPLHARRLAELAVSVLPAAPADGIRIGLEAHFLYAAASGRPGTAIRYQFADFGPPWARVLLACSAAVERRGDLRMALDLASWAASTAQQLIPVAAGFAPLAGQCIACHGRMLIATGDQQGGEVALATARALGGAAPGS